MGGCCGRQPGSRHTQLVVLGVVVDGLVLGRRVWCGGGGPIESNQSSLRVVCAVEMAGRGARSKADKTSRRPPLSTSPKKAGRGAFTPTPIRPPAWWHAAIHQCERARSLERPMPLFWSRSIGLARLASAAASLSPPPPPRRLSIPPTHPTHPTEEAPAQQPPSLLPQTPSTHQGWPPPPPPPPPPPRRRPARYVHRQRGAQSPNPPHPITPSANPPLTLLHAPPRPRLPPLPPAAAPAVAVARRCRGCSPGWKSTGPSSSTM